MAMTKKFAYTILNLTPDCKTKDIEKNYRRLAMEWYPQKHSYSALANEKFKQITHAYRMLMSSDKKQDDMNMSEMMELFRKVFLKQSNNYAAARQEVIGLDLLSDSDYDDDDEDDDNEYDDDDDDYEDIDDDDDDNSFESDAIVAGILSKVVVSALERKSNLKEKEIQAEKNGLALVAEEDKEKLKAEKRRAKKKRRKEKKKLEKTQKQNEDEKTTEDEKCQSSSASEEEYLDPTSAFVAVVANKKLSGSSQVCGPKLGEEKLKKTSRSDAQDENTNLQNIDPVIIQSRQLAIRGNQMAAMDEYSTAISFFTAAIKLDPQDFRYFGNRSYCYERSGLYDRALKDAQRAIEIDPIWPKGHFRKGRALCGLLRFAEAEECFQEVLKLDKNCTEAFTELKAARTSGIMEMGFQRHLAEDTATKFDSIQDAVNFLVQESASSSKHIGNWDTTKGASNCLSNGYQSSEIYESDEDEFLVQERGNRNFLKDEKMDPQNTENKGSLWVGNLRKEATEKSITSLFSKYGELLSVRVLLESRCAFVNYKSPRAASKAMEALQGLEYFGEHLLIRFPNHNHVAGQPSVTVLKRKTTPTVKTKSPNTDFKGPVNGDECFFWRLAGCIHGIKCRYKHIPKHKGIDLK